MKKVITAIFTIATCGALFTGMWPQNDSGEKVPVETVTAVISTEEAEISNSVLCKHVRSGNHKSRVRTSVGDHRTHGNAGGNSRLETDRISTVFG